MEEKIEDAVVHCSIKISGLLNESIIKMVDGNLQIPLRGIVNEAFASAANEIREEIKNAILKGVESTNVNSDLNDLLDATDEYLSEMSDFEDEMPSTDSSLGDVYSFFDNHSLPERDGLRRLVNSINKKRNVCGINR